MSLFNTVVSVLGYSVVVLSFIQKVPQLIKVVRAGKAESLSLVSIQLDIVSYTIAASYGYINQLSYYAYGEMIILLAQSITLLFLVVYYNGLFNRPSLHFSMAIFAIWICCILMDSIPEKVLTAQVLLSIPISATSKLAQVRSLLRSRRAGQVSLQAYCISSYGCTVRVLTTFVEDPSYPNLFNYALSAVLNMLIATLIIRYKDNNETEKEKNL